MEKWMISHKVVTSYLNRIILIVLLGVDLSMRQHSAFIFCCNLERGVWM